MTLDKKLIIFGVLQTLFIFMALWALFGHIRINPETLEAELYDKYFTVGCDSNSMGMTLDCQDVVYTSRVKPDDRLYPGDIYVYANPHKNGTIVHRLVYCLSDDCSQAIFKGDNNVVGELVNRTDILYRVEGVDYR